MEQRANIKFCFKLGKSATNTFEMIQTVYGSEAMSRKNVFKWYARFSDGRESIEDDPRPGASSTVRDEKNVQKVAEILRNDRYASTRLIEELTGIPKTTVHRILTENLGKRKICSRFVPHSLTDDQKDCRVEHCRDMQRSAARDPDFMSCIVTGDETWCFQSVEIATAITISERRNFYVREKARGDYVCPYRHRNNRGALENSRSRSAETAWQHGLLISLVALATIKYKYRERTRAIHSTLYSEGIHRSSVRKESSKPSFRTSPQHRRVRGFHLGHPRKGENGRTIRSAPQLTSELYQETGKSANPQTVRRALKESGYNGRIARRKPYVNKINRRKRLNFAKEYLSKEEEWRINEEWKPKNLRPTVKHGAGSVIVWGCISSVGVGELVTRRSSFNSQDSDKVTIPKKMSKDKASTSKDEVSVRQILDAMNKQNESTTRMITELHHQIQLLTQQANEENLKRTREIEILGRSVAEIRLGVESQRTLITEDFKSINTTARDKPEQMTRQTKDNIPIAPELPETDSDDEFPTHSRQQLSAKDAIRYIPVLNGDDDIGVEDFIKEIRAMKARCSQTDLLLKAIKVDNIIEKAAQSIRNIPIENYADLFTALRSNVAIQVTSDEYSEQLRELKQGREESIQSFNIRFRRILNKLTYAITNENPQPLTRRIMLEATMRKVNRIYLRGLRNEIGRILLSNEPTSLGETEKKAADIERYVREEQREWKKQVNRPITNQHFSKRPGPPIAHHMNRSNTNTSVFTKTKRTPLTERIQTKCFKCGKLGHMAPQCRNFQLLSQRNLPPPKVNQIGIEEIQEKTGEEQYESTQHQEDYSLQYYEEEQEDQVYIIDTGARTNLLKEHKAKATIHEITKPQKFYMGQDKYFTNRYINADIYDKTHKFYIVPKDFPLIEDGIIGLPCLEKYKYEITNDKLKLNNNILYFQKPGTIPPGEKRVQTVYFEGKPTRVCFCNSGETSQIISNEIENSKDLDQIAKFKIIVRTNHIEPELCKPIEKILIHYVDVFNLETDLLPCTDLTKHTITLKQDKIINTKSYRPPECHKTSHDISLNGKKEKTHPTDLT
ncbi:Protein GVQW3 [Anthophora retusa]